VDRHEWNLCVTPERHEIDEYDDDGSEYLVVHDEGHHLTSCRLRQAASRTLLIDHFAGIFPGAEDFLHRQRDALYELTRFLRTPDLDARQSVRVLVEFARGLDEFRDERHVSGFVAVVYPGISRFLRQNGVRFIVLDIATLGGRRVELICLTHAVATPRLLRLQNAYARGEIAYRPTPRSVQGHCQPLAA
jgi:N-acyl-L-homoserine lactone synthetase